MPMDVSKKIEEQRKLLEAGNPKIDISRACRIEDGIQRIQDEEELGLIRLFEKKAKNLSICFFVPASGSGSRMFSFLYDFLKAQGDQSSEELTQHFLNKIESFAFYNKLPQRLKDDIATGDFNFEELIEYLLEKEGLSFSNLPKGLIPFHSYGSFMITPIQEHLIQGYYLGGNECTFHFTINENYKTQILKNKEILEEFTGLKYNLDWSIQDPTTNSVAFNENLTPLEIDGKVVTRPSGHGALLHNLNSIDSDIVFIRNIDNIQHSDKSETSIRTRKLLGAKLIDFRESVKQILQGLEIDFEVTEKIDFLNHTFNLRLSDEQITDKEFMKSYLNRPMRICGMVVNEGQPGGGPFWVKNSNGIEQRQIIEKAQLSTQTDQLKLVTRSTHFNPNEIVCYLKDYKGNKFNLLDFANSEQYFVVKKKMNGQDITFIENPGLWNGGMANWLTLFYEIDAKCFSPVKTVLDLLKKPHLED